MIEIKPTNEGIKIGDGKTLTAKSIGTWQGIVEEKNGKRYPITLTDVAFVPNACANLFSITKSIKNGFKIGNKKQMITLEKGKTKLTFDRIYESNLVSLPELNLLPIIRIQT